MSKYKLRLDTAPPSIDGLEADETVSEISLSFKNLSETQGAEKKPGPGKVTAIVKRPGSDPREIRFDYSL
ncbi:MAG: hypothetical protein ACREPD_04705 [Stenotrophomonas sp.]|uniref:hypothetical protein n=1 Tax=Stenotrophomonas sp. TaxID=69392 RepID=UPI003D6D361B